MKVSCCVITYNHERFIRQSLDSILMQETDFDFEIVIGDDNSSDQTRPILIEYMHAHPEKIRLLLHEQNQGYAGKKNLVSALHACEGEYIALLEGDDFWTAPDKLQKQVAFLDTHPECAACFHNVNVIYDDNVKPEHPFHATPLKDFFSLEDVVLNFFIPTCSTMFRNRLPNPFPEWYFDMPMGDWPLHVMNAEHGHYGYIHAIKATYRVHEGGMWSNQASALTWTKTINAAEIINHYLGYRFDYGLRRNISHWHYVIALSLCKTGQTGKVFHHIWQHILTAPDFRNIAKKEIIRLMLHEIKALI